jgi:hypothetical protein
MRGSNITYYSSSPARYASFDPWAESSIGDDCGKPETETEPETEP